MKKIIITIAVLIAVFAAGFFYVAKVRSDEGKAVETQLANQYPPAVPEVILDPTIGYPI